MLLEYLYCYLINPFFLMVDYIYEYKTTKKEDKIEKYEYDIEKDEIKITYFTNYGKKYILKVDRKVDLDLKETITRLKEMETKEVIYGVTYNGKDILEQVSLYLGPSGSHNNFKRLLVRDVLTEEQISNFETLCIVDGMCEINELNELNDYIL